MTVSIMVLTLTVGAVNYLRFLNKQNLYKAASTAEGMLKDARAKAQNGFLGDEEIGFCQQLQAVEVFSAEDANNGLYLSAQLHCANDLLLTYDSYTIEPSSISLNHHFKVAFLAKNGSSVNIDGETVASGSATLTYDNNDVTLNFDQGGNVNVQYQ